MNHYEEKKRRKIDRFNDLAQKNREKSESLYNSSSAISDMIPLGQPILVGHHSEGRHRRDLSRIRTKMDQSIEADKKAAYYEKRAIAATSNRAISSDDPEAVTKLKEKIDKAQEIQDVMKATNKLVKQILKGGEPYNPDDIAALCKIARSPNADKLLTPDFCGRTGFASYQLTNNNANISRMKKRLIELEAHSQDETKSYMIGEIEVVENVEENRIQLLFPGKPDQDTRTRLKSYGFRWSPTNEAWQRHLNNAGKHAANEFLKTN